MIELELLDPPTQSLDLSAVVAQWSPATQADDVARQIVPCGSRMLEMGELFRIRGNYQQQCSHWHGELSRVSGLGAFLNSGELIAEGNVGNRAGFHMSGGTLIIDGNTGDDLGCEMSGGTVWVSGSTGDRAGGCGSGSNPGMRGGLMAVAGNAGAGLGLRLRRGSIVVGGNVGVQGGFQMIAGTVVIGGMAGPGLAHEMKRGTVLAQCASHNATDSPRFRWLGQVQGGFLSVLARLLATELTTSFPNRDVSKLEAVCQTLERPWRAFSGDHLQGGVGELLVAAEP
jgi:formylmethanofuran dehydrogenase subunit C